MDSGDDPALQDCPYICPKPGDVATSKPQHDATIRRQSHGNPHASPYTPGMIKPLEPKVYPPDAPPKYLPQPTDSTSGDILGMGPIGPWAAGHVDWNPTAGVTGTRPVVDKYSITRYSTGAWRQHNERNLSPKVVDKCRNLESDLHKTYDGANNKINNAKNASNKALKEKINELSQWKKKVEDAIHGMAEEIETLDRDRARLKGACRILMLPEAISRECLELRTHRYEPDLVRDDAEQELIKEVAIVGEIRKVFNDTLNKVENQMANNKAAKSAIEQDWSDKLITMRLDKTNLSLTDDSSIILYHPGVARWPENACTYEYWLHFCAESIRNCEDVRKASENLRGDLMATITKGNQDLKTQSERTNAALADAIATTEALCDRLEEALKEVLQKIADVENLIDHYHDKFRKMDEASKITMTRLHARNYDRPNVENCRDNAQYALIAEAKLVKETLDSLNGKLRDAEVARSELMKKRGDLEKEIACKRKSLNIDRDRFGRLRAFLPSPEEYASG